MAAPPDSRSFGDGYASERIFEVLPAFPLDPQLFRKRTGKPIVASGGMGDAGEIDTMTGVLGSAAEPNTVVLRV
jgi:hypothetical protein